MNKEKIVEELNEYIKGLNPKLSVKRDRDDDLVLRYNRIRQAWFCEFNRDRFTLHVDSELGALFIKEGYLTKFYNKAVELLKQNEKKYTIKVVNNDRGYLFFDDIAKEYSFANKNNKFFKSYFTQSEIEELKQQADVAIDWNKAIIKEVTD